MEETTEPEPRGFRLTLLMLKTAVGLAAVTFVLFAPLSVENVLRFQHSGRAPFRLTANWPIAGVIDEAWLSIDATGLECDDAVRPDGSEVSYAPLGHGVWVGYSTYGESCEGLSRMELTGMMRDPPPWFAETVPEAVAILWAGESPSDLRGRAMEEGLIAALAFAVGLAGLRLLRRQRLREIGLIK